MSCGRTENDDEDNSALPLAKAKPIFCIRCRILAPVILLREIGYCDECFMITLMIKFRKGLDCAKDRSREGPAKDRSAVKFRKSTDRSSAMLAFSGGQSSRALLELLHAICPPAVTPAEDAKKGEPRIFSTIEVVYIDESGVPGYGVDNIAEIRKIVEAFGYDLIILKLEDVFAEDSSLEVDVNSSELNSIASSSTDHSITPLSKLLNLLQPHTATSRTSLHTTLLHSLIRQSAIERKHEILITGETSTRLAIKVLSGMAEGRGFNMGEEVGASWDCPVGDTTLLHVRPLSQMLLKEIAFYCHRQSLSFVAPITSATTVAIKQAGIESLTEDFVNNLEATFPSTVSTILRTAGKLGMRTADAQERGIKSTPCPLCGLPAQLGAADWKRSNTISTFTDPIISQNVATSSSSTLPLASILCYGCLLVYQGVQQTTKYTSTPNLIHLPPYVAKAAFDRWDDEEEAVVRRGRIKDEKEILKEIGEYLLE